MPDLQVFVQDNIPLGSTRTLTEDGFLTAHAVILRAGVLVYDAKDVKVPGEGKVRVYRTPESVFHPETLASIRRAPITRGHPPEKVVTSQNWREWVAGNVLGSPEKESETLLGADVVIRDQDSIQDVIEHRTEELSVGALQVLDKAPPNETNYDYMSVGPIIVNHNALVSAGRQGPSVRVSDEGEQNMTTPSLTDILSGVGAEFRTALKGAFEDAGITNKSKESDITKIVTDAMAPLVKRIDDTETAAVQKEADAKATKEVNDAMALVQTAERNRARVLLDHADLIPADKRDAMMGASVKDILVSLVGDSVPDAASRDEGFLMGVLAMKRKERDAVTGFRSLDGSAVGTNDAEGDPIEAAKQKAIVAKRDAYLKTPQKP